MLNPWARESGEITSEQVRNIVREAVSKTAKSMKEEGLTLREIAKEAVIVSTEELKKSGNATREQILAAVDGVIERIKGFEQEALDATQKELQQFKNRLKEQEKISWQWMCAKP